MPSTTIGTRRFLANTKICPMGLVALVDGPSKPSALGDLTAFPHPTVADTFLTCRFPCATR